MQYNTQMKTIEYALGKEGRPVLRNVLLRNDGVIATDGFMLAYLKTNGNSGFDMSTVETVEDQEVVVDGTGFVSLLKDVDQKHDGFIHVTEIKENVVVFKYFSKTSKVIEERELPRSKDQYPDVLKFIEDARNREISAVRYINLNLKLVERVMKVIKPYHADKLKSIPVVFRYHGENNPIYISSRKAKEYEVVLMPMTLDKSDFESFGIKEEVKDGE